MKSDSLGLTFRTEKEKTVSSILYKMVIEIRKELAKSHDVVSGDKKNYTGLCDIAVNMLHDKLKVYAETNYVEIESRSIHGEQRHTWKLHSCLWPLQHTWAVVKMMDVTMYVDPTSGQFSRLYFYIPDFYISTRKPKWYYPDNKNPAYCNKITRYLNDHIKIPVHITQCNGSVIKGKEGIIEFIQYQIWGKFCDLMHKQERPMIRRL